MSELIKIKKGLDINLKGKAEKVLVKVEPSKTYAVKPPDFTGLTPKLAVKVDDIVKAGSPLFYDKNNPKIQLTSPVSGKVVEINRGERRKILEVIVEPDGSNISEEFTKGEPKSLSKEDITENLLKSGLWAHIIQRPYGIIANPENSPKAIFISGFDSAPLGVDLDFILQDSEKEFRTGIEALKKLTPGKIHIGVNGKYPVNNTFEKAGDIEINKFSGPHPAGNVGTQIHKIDPVNKGEIVWTINPQSVVSIGKLFLTGTYDATKIVAITGSQVIKPRYFKIIAGCNVASLTDQNIEGNNNRFISGNVLTGSRIEPDGFVGFYDSQITVIPEGDHHEFMGWLAPGLKKFSLSHSFLTWMMPKKEYVIDSNIHGGKRALMITGNFEKVFPFNIFPMQLIKAVIIEDIDLMEKLGIYEVTEEDFALCEFIDTSKTDIQSIIRKGLDLMIKEMC